jgi:hypothetical protein
MHMAYEGGGEWHVLIGSVCRFFLLALAIQPRLNPRVMYVLSSIASVLILIQVLAMR